MQGLSMECSSTHSMLRSALLCAGCSVLHDTRDVHGPLAGLVHLHCSLKVGGTLDRREAKVLHVLLALLVCMLGDIRAAFTAGPCQLHGHCPPDNA